MKTRALALVLFGLLLAVPFVFAAEDYRSMTAEELCKSYPSAMQNPAEKQAFQQEWQKRMQSMTPQERQSMYQKEAQRQRGATTTTPAPMGQAGTKDYVTMSHEDFNKLCQNQQYMQGLTPEQRMEIDQEWQRRIPYMTPQERQMYYPEGRRYYTGA